LQIKAKKHFSPKSGSLFKQQTLLAVKHLVCQYSPILYCGVYHYSPTQKKVFLIY